MSSATMNAGPTSRRAICSACWNQVVLELAGPQAVAKQLGDQGTLAVVFMLRDATGLEGLAREVATEHEGQVVGDVVPGEAEKCLLGLEVADLQDAPHLVVQTGAATGQGQLGCGQSEVFQALGVVEVRPSVQGLLFGGREYGQLLVGCFRHCRARVLRPGRSVPG